MRSLVVFIVGCLLVVTAVFSMDQYIKDSLNGSSFCRAGKDGRIHPSVYIVSRLACDQKERHVYRVDPQAIHLSRCLSTFFIWYDEHAYDMSIAEHEKSKNVPLAVDFSDEQIRFFVTLLNTVQQENLSDEKIVTWVRILSDDYETIALSEVFRIVQFFNVPRIMCAIHSSQSLIF